MLYHRACFTSLKGVKTYHSLTTHCTMSGCSTTEHVSLLWRVWKLTIALRPIAPWVDALPQSMFHFFEGCIMYHSLTTHCTMIGCSTTEHVSLLWRVWKLTIALHPLHHDWMLYHRACFASLKSVKTYDSLTTHCTINGCSTTEHVSLLWRVWKLTIALRPIAPWVDMLYHRACFTSLKGV